MVLRHPFPSHGSHPPEKWCKSRAPNFSMPLSKHSPAPESSAGSCSTLPARGRERQRGPIPRLVDSRLVDHYSLTARAEHGLHIAVPKSRGDACVAPTGPEPLPRGEGQRGP